MGIFSKLKLIPIGRHSIWDRDNDTEAKVGVEGGLLAEDFALEVAEGNIGGHFPVNKFSRNIEIDSGVVADIWDGGHTAAVSLIWVAPTQARIHAIVSSSVEDSAPGGVVAEGDGAKTIRIWGLKTWDSIETSEDITMDGTTAVNTANSYVIIHRIEVLTKGDHASGPNVGIIKATAATDNTITAQIRAGQGQTQMGIFGIPSTQKLYLTRLYGNVNKAGGATGLIDIHLCSNPEPETELKNFLVKHTFGLQTVGTSALTINFGMSKEIVGPAIIKIQAVSGTDNMDLSAGFDGYLINN